MNLGLMMMRRFSAVAKENFPAEDHLRSSAEDDDDDDQQPACR